MAFMILFAIKVNDNGCAFHGDYIKTNGMYLCMGKFAVVVFVSVLVFFVVLLVVIRVVKHKHGVAKARGKRKEEKKKVD